MVMLDFLYYWSKYINNPVIIVTNIVEVIESISVRIFSFSPFSGFLITIKPHIAFSFMRLKVSVYFIIALAWEVGSTDKMEVINMCILVCK